MKYVTEYISKFRHNTQQGGGGMKQNNYLNNKLANTTDPTIRHEEHLAVGARVDMSSVSYSVVELPLSKSVSDAYTVEMFMDRVINFDFNQPMADDHLVLEPINF